MIDPQRRYGDMPLVVLTAGQYPMPPNVPADVREQAALYFQALASGHDVYAALSTRGHNQLVPDAGRFIQFGESRGGSRGYPPRAGRHWAAAAQTVDGPLIQRW